MFHRPRAHRRTALGGLPALAREYAIEVRIVAGIPSSLRTWACSMPVRTRGLATPLHWRQSSSSWAGRLERCDRAGPRSRDPGRARLGDRPSGRDDPRRTDAPRVARPRDERIRAISAGRAARLGRSAEAICSVIQALRSCPAATPRARLPRATGTPGRSDSPDCCVVPQRTRPGDCLLRKLAAALLAVPVLALFYVPVVLRRPCWRALGLHSGSGASSPSEPSGSSRRAASWRHRRSRAIVPLTNAAFSSTIASGTELNAPASITFSAPMDQTSVAASLDVEPGCGRRPRLGCDWDRPDDHAEDTAGRQRPITRSRFAPELSGASGRPMAVPARAVFLTRAATVGKIEATALAGSQAKVNTAFRISFDHRVDIAHLPCRPRRRPCTHRHRRRGRHDPGQPDRRLHRLHAPTRTARSALIDFQATATAALGTRRRWAGTRPVLKGATGPQGPAPAGPKGATGPGPAAFCRAGFPPHRHAGVGTSYEHAGDRGLPAGLHMVSGKASSYIRGARTELWALVTCRLLQKSRAGTETVARRRRTPTSATTTTSARRST